MELIFDVSLLYFFLRKNPGVQVPFRSHDVGAGPDHGDFLPWGPTHRNRLAPVAPVAPPSLNAGNIDGLRGLKSFQRDCPSH